MLALFLFGCLVVALIRITRLERELKQARGAIFSLELNLDHAYRRIREYEMYLADFLTRVD